MKLISVTSLKMADAMSVDTDVVAITTLATTNVTTNALTTTDLAM